MNIMHSRRHIVGLLAVAAVAVATPVAAQVDTVAAELRSKTPSVERLRIIPTWRSSGSGRKSRRRASARAVAPSSRCSRHELGRSSIATPPANLLVGDRGVDVDDWFSSTGVRQRLPWGSGTWSASWETSRTTTNNPISSFDPSLQSGFQLAFSQPLLRDRTIDAARQQYTIAKRNQESSELRFREAVVQTIAAVKQAYWTLKATRANVMVQQRSLDLAQELARENRVRVEAGQIPPLDLVQAEAEVAQRREGLIRANTVAADAEDALRRLIVDPADASFWRVRDRGRLKTPRRSPHCPTSTQQSKRRSTIGTTSRARATSWRMREPRSIFCATSVCPTCGSKRRTAATALAARSSCAVVVFRASSRARAAAVSATPSARCSPATTRRGASG